MMKPMNNNELSETHRFADSSRAGLVCLVVLLLVVLAAAANAVAPPLALSAERYTLSGTDVAVWNLAGKVDVVRGTGKDVVVVVDRAGRDAEDLKIVTGDRRGRSALCVIYPGKRVVYPAMGSGSSTNLQVRADGTFDDHGGIATRVTVAGRGNGIEAHADLHLEVPEGRDVEIHLAAGAAHADRVSADLLIDTGCGGVETDDTRGRLKIHTGSGAVNVSTVRGDLSVDTGSGDVTVQDVTGGLMHVDTGSGSVAINHAQVAKLDVDTGSGGVEIEGASADDVHVDTGSGRVSVALDKSPKQVTMDTGSGGVVLRVPDGYSAEFDLESGSGGIELEMPHKVTDKDDGKLRGTIGSGEGRLKVDTGSGGIQILQGRSHGD